MSQSLPGRSASRRPPPKVDAVVLNGVRFEQARSGLPLDASDVSGWMRATDIATETEKWLVQVYTNPSTEADPALPGGGRSVIYMKAIAIDGDVLIVTDTLGRRHRVDPETGSATPLE